MVHTSMILKVQNGLSPHLHLHPDIIMIESMVTQHGTMTTMVHTIKLTVPMVNMLYIPTETNILLTHGDTIVIMMPRPILHTQNMILKVNGITIT